MQIEECKVQSDPTRLKGLPWVRRVVAEEVPQLEAIAAGDGHTIVAPTHIVERAGEIVGYFSIGAVPMILAWAHTKRMRSRESIHALNVAENYLATVAPGATICVPCVAGSPFEPYMAGLGYRNFGQATINLKKVS